MDNTNQPSFSIQLFGYIKNLEKEFHKITEGRKNKLLALSEYISKKIKAEEPADIIVICTHNSRRSHIGQIWLKTAAYFYGIENIRVFSGGTEATAFYPSAIKALNKIGFNIEKTEDKLVPNSLREENPIYECPIGNDGPTLMLYSKKYDDPNNVQEGFAALMVCNSADEACPVIMGAETRFAITYKDPKIADGTPQEEAKYLERVRQIGREMFFVMKNSI